VIRDDAIAIEMTIDDDEFKISFSIIKFNISNPFDVNSPGNVVIEGDVGNDDHWRIAPLRSLP
jgi:hypothetical protein